jgi:Holliday junction resolvase-like predicted endonuclease
MSDWGLNLWLADKKLYNRPMSSTETGRKAEAAAKAYLEMRHFTVIEQNFRRPRCEIDIVATKDDVAYLVEVKYRRTDQQDNALDYITDSKLRQMRYAAETWAAEYKWSTDYRSATIEVAGKDFTIMHFIDNAT